MIGSLYSGISGLKANTSAMAVIGDNIANVATTGFKSSQVSFANIFSSTLNRTGLEIGRGVTLNAIKPQWEAGSLENTNSATDLSVNGTGLFIVNDPSTNISYYTRAGQFEWDNDGNLVTPDGFIVQGSSLATDGTVEGIDNITLPNGTSAPCHSVSTWTAMPRMVKPSPVRSPPMIHWVQRLFWMLSSNMTKPFRNGIGALTSTRRRPSAPPRAISPSM
jgi:flagellar hook-basal body protein